jgi:hypothetical protein
MSSKLLSNIGDVMFLVVTKNLPKEIMLMLCRS